MPSACSPFCHCCRNKIFPVPPKRVVQPQFHFLEKSLKILCLLCVKIFKSLCSCFCFNYCLTMFNLERPEELSVRRSVISFKTQKLWVNFSKKCYLILEVNASALYFFEDLKKKDASHCILYGQVSFCVLIN